MFHYCDANGFVAIGPTVRVWRGLKLSLSGEHSRAFAQTGISENPAALAAELSDAQRGSAAYALHRAARKASQVLVLTDGVGVAQEWLR
jgi:hypothetical protein